MAQLRVHYPPTYSVFSVYPITDDSEPAIPSSTIKIMLLTYLYLARDIAGWTRSSFQGIIRGNQLVVPLLDTEEVWGEYLVNGEQTFTLTMTDPVEDRQYRFAIHEGADEIEVWSMRPISSGDQALVPVLTFDIDGNFRSQI